MLVRHGFVWAGIAAVFVPQMIFGGLDSDVILSSASTFSSGTTNARDPNQRETSQFPDTLEQTNRTKGMQALSTDYSPG